MSLKIEQGDITKYEVDAIVNAANTSLLGGGGVDGAIHRAAGSELLAECRTLNGCPTGEAKITKGYSLKAKFIVHTPGPVYYDERKEECEMLLRSCYKNSIQRAKENGCKSIAFPLISAGVYGYPKDQALSVAVECIQRFADDMDVTIVLFDQEVWQFANTKYSELIG